MTDPNNILSRNAAVRTPSCPNITVIGNGKCDDYVGIEKLNLIHVVSFCYARTVMMMSLTRPKTIQNSTKSR